MNGYRVRNDPLDDGSLVVVRGSRLERMTLRVDAIAAHARFGQYGISVFAAIDTGAIDDLARTRLATFAQLSITTVADLRRTGLEIIPTFRRPHCTILLPELDTDLDRLLRCHTVTAINPHHESDKDEQ